MVTDLSFSIKINGIEKTITSTAEANKVIRELTKNFVELSKAGKDVSQTLLQIGQANKIKDGLVQVSRGAVQMQQGMQGAQTASANASMALLNLNYVIRDSPYFFNNFALGVLAVGNNINPLIDSFNRLRTEAVGKSISTFQLLKQALVGGAGISIAFSLVVTAIQSFVFWQSRQKTETEEATKSLDSEIDKLRDLSTAYDEARLSNAKLMQTKYGDREANLQGYITELSAKQKAGKYVAGTGLGVGEPFRPIPELLTEYRAELSRLQSLMKSGDPLYESFQQRLSEITVAAGTGVGALRDLNVPLLDLKQALKAFGDAFDKALPQDREAWRKKYDNLKEAIKQLDLLQSKLKDVNKVVTGGDTTLDALNRKINFFGEAKYKGQDVRNFRGDVVNRKSVSSSVGNKEGAFQIGKGIKDLDTNLELGKIAAQELGNAISSAFEQGTISLNKFINSLIAAITKMLILRAVTAFLTGGGSAVSMVAQPSAGVGIPSGAGFDAAKFNKPMNNVNIQGKISVNKNKFVIDIENATQSYNNNAKLVTIGRD